MPIILERTGKAESWLAALMEQIVEPDSTGEHRLRVSSHIDQLLVPQGSLGRLADIATWLAEIQRTVRPVAKRRALIIFAGDHGVTAEGISAYQADVTANVCRSFSAGAGAANVLAKAVSAEIFVVDTGVNADLSDLNNVVHKKIAHGTQNMVLKPAATRDETLRALEVGAQIVNEKAGQYDIISFGEVGIGNTTASSAVFSALSGLPPEEVVGRGTGVGPETLRRKTDVVRRALELHTSRDPIDVLSCLGGYEISALVGGILAAVANRKPVVLDGYITSVAAYTATLLSDSKILPRYLLASHLSAEQGHAKVLHKLGLNPVLSLGLRIGEGTGTLMAFPVIDAACRVLSEIHTFEEAGLAAPVLPDNLL